MDIEEQVSNQNKLALMPHEWHVFEEALSKPFFLAPRYKELDKKCPQLIRGK